MSARFKCSLYLIELEPYFYSRNISSGSFPSSMLCTAVEENKISIQNIQLAQFRYGYSTLDDESIVRDFGVLESTVKHIWIRSFTE